MSTVGTNSSEENRFKTISDFKDCMIRNGEVEFEWNEKIYSITQPQNGISISEVNKQDTEKICFNADELMEYLVDGVKLRDIIT